MTGLNVAAGELVQPRKGLHLVRRATASLLIRAVTQASTHVADSRFILDKSTVLFKYLTQTR